MTVAAHGLESGIEGHAPDGVVDKVKYHATGVVLDVVLDGLGAIFDERRSELLNVSALRLRIDRKDLCAKCLGDLDGYLSHAAATTMNQNFPTGGNGGAIDQAFPGGNEYERQRSGLTHGKVGWLERHQICIDGGEFRQRTLVAAYAAGHPIDLVTFAIARYAGTNCLDGTRHVQPEDRGRRMMGMRGRAVEDFGVEWIDAARGDPNQDLASAWLRTQNVSQAEWCAVVLKNCRFHGASAHEVLPRFAGWEHELTTLPLKARLLYEAHAVVFGSEPAGRMQRERALSRALTIELASSAIWDRISANPEGCA